jgi:hypothetical protein
VRKNKADLNSAAQVAARMAEGWNNEYLQGKTPEDLIRAYGCSEESAKQILNNELTERNLRR